MSLAALLEWWNFIFALPLAVGGVLLLGLALSGMIDLNGDHATATRMLMRTPTTRETTRRPRGDAHLSDAHADHAVELHADAGDATTPTAAGQIRQSSKPPTPATTTTPLPRNRSGSRR
jgi:hypothetical protein